MTPLNSRVTAAVGGENKITGSNTRKMPDPVIMSGDHKNIT